jgi:hypothetical protein
MMMEGQVTLRIGDPEGLFELILEHIYTETTDFLKPKNLVPLFELAFYFRLNSLQDDIRAHLANPEVFHPEEQFNPDVLNVVVHQISRLSLQPLPDCFICFLARSFYEIQGDDCFMNCPPPTLVRVLMSPELRISSDTQLAEFVADAHQRYQFPELVLDEILSTVCWERVSDRDWDLRSLRIFRSQKTRLLDLPSPIYGFSHAQLERRYAHYTILMERTPFALESNFFEHAAEYGASVSEAISDGGHEIVVSMNGQGGIDVNEVMVVVTPPNQVIQLWVGLYDESNRVEDEAFARPEQDKEEISVQFDMYSGNRMLDKLVIRIPFQGEPPKVVVKQASGVVSRGQCHEAAPY